MAFDRSLVRIGGQLYERLCEVTCGGARWTDLRVAFKIEKSHAKNPNSAEIVLYNLTPEHRAEFIVRGTPLTIRAGYQAVSTNDVIYTGEIMESASGRDGAEWKTTVHCRDGDTAWLQFSAHSFGQPTPKVKLGELLAADLGYKLSSDARARLQAAGSTRGPIVLHGNSYAQMDKLLTPLGLAWSVQDGQLQIIDGGGATAEQAIVLSPDSGLLGTPEPMERFNKQHSKHRIPAGIKLRSLILPGIRPGRLVQVESAAVRGTYVVRKAEFNGDTHGNDWQIDIEARAVS